MKRFFFAAFFVTLALTAFAESPIQYFKTEQPRVHYFKIAPDQARLDILLSAGGLTASEFRKRNKSHLVINGGFFDIEGKSLGLIMRHGQEVNSLRKNSWAVFLLGGKDSKQPMIVSRDEWLKNQKSFGNVQLALQVGPRLVVDGKTPSFKENTIDRRSAIGITPDGHILIAMAEQPFWLKEWATVLSKYCSQALNLDGGGSSQISFHDKGVNLDIDGDTPVPNAISVAY